MQQRLYGVIWLPKHVIERIAVLPPPSDSVGADVQICIENTARKIMIANMYKALCGFDDDDYELEENDASFEPEPKPQEPPESQEAEDQDAPQHVQQLQDGDAYGGGPTDLSLLSLYHKHRAIPIWHAHPDDEIVKNPLRSLANGKKILDIPKPEKTELWFWDRLKATGLEPLVHTSFGKFLNHERMSRSEGADMVSNYLGVQRDDIVAEFHNMRALKIRYTYLQQIYMELKETCETMESEECSEEEMEPFRESITWTMRLRRRQVTWPDTYPLFRDG
ncbi:hypothetical protein P8452_43012 [Trifolium repens]|nr:hypothetical protein P8452_43012 [Trifolium repens]